MVSLSLCVGPLAIQTSARKGAAAAAESVPFLQFEIPPAKVFFASAPSSFDSAREA